MPIYEYQCGVCGHQLEAIQGMSEQPLTHCPECNKDTLTKLVSAAGFQLKGTGWYATDFRDSGKKTDVKKEKPQQQTSTPSSSKETPVSTSTKSDSKGDS